MKGEIARAGAGERVVPGRSVRSEQGRARVQVIDGDAIQAQVIDQHIAIVTGYGGAMCVRGGLAFGIRAVARVLKAGGGFAEPSSWEHPEGCGAAAVIVSDKDGFPRVIDRDIARSSTPGGNNIDESQLGTRD